MCGPAFLGKSDGGWGAPHSAGALTNTPSASVKIALTSHDIASPELMAALPFEGPLAPKMWPLK